MPHRARASVLLLLAAGYACGDAPPTPPEVLSLLPHEEPSPDQARFETEDSAGVTIVRNGLRGAWGPGLIPVERTLLIGEVDEAGPYQFNGISRIEVTDDGTIVVAEGATTGRVVTGGEVSVEAFRSGAIRTLESGRIRVYDRDGAYLRQIGRRGNGPGEFVDIEGMWLAGDTAWIEDAGQARLTALSLSGEILGEWRLVSSQGGRTDLVTRGEKGWIAEISEPWVRVADVGIEEGEPYQYPSTEYGLWSPEEGTLGSPLFEVPGRKGYAFYAGAFLDGERTEIVSVRTRLFDRSAGWAFDRTGRLYVTVPAAYRIDVFDPDGTFVRSIRRDFEPVPIRDSDIEELEERYYAYRYHREDEDAPAVLRRLDARMHAKSSIRVRAELGLPPHLPPIGTLRGSRDGFLVVKREDTMAPPDQYMALFTDAASPSRWDLFDPEGRFLGAVELPPRFTLYRLVGLDVIGVQLDEFDVEHVARYRIVAPAPS